MIYAKHLVIFTLILILAACQILTEEENAVIQKICGTNMTLPSPLEKQMLYGIEVKNSTEAPWSVSVIVVKDTNQTEDQLVHCSGTLISQRHVLTARHCFLNDQIIKNNVQTFSWVDDEPWNKTDHCIGVDLEVPWYLIRRSQYFFDTICAPGTECQQNKNFSISFDNLKLVGKSLGRSSSIQRGAKTIILPGMCNATGIKDPMTTNDFAIVELDKDIKFSHLIHPVCVSKDDFRHGDMIEKASMFGYGADKTAPTTNGALKHEFLTISLCEIPRQDWMCTITVIKKLFPCAGEDSGAGAVKLIDNVMTIGGVLSRSRTCSRDPDRVSQLLVPIMKHNDDICKYAGVCTGINQSEIDKVESHQIAKFYEPPRSTVGPSEPTTTDTVSPSEPTTTVTVVQREPITTDQTSIFYESSGSSSTMFEAMSIFLFIKQFF